MWHCDNREIIVIKTILVYYCTGLGEVSNGEVWGEGDHVQEGERMGELIDRARHCESEGLCMKQA